MSSIRRSLLVAASLGILLALAYLLEGLRYSRGTLAEPGPGLYPLLVGVLMLVSSLGAALEITAGGSMGQVDWPQGVERRRVLAIAAASLTYVLLVPYLGHPMTGALLTLVVLQVMGTRSWPLKLVVALGLGLGSYYLFGVLLDVSLPLGAWFS